MKMNKKKVLVSAIAVGLIAILSFGTIAWYTAQDSVTNNFLVGDSDTPADKVFGVDVWELGEGGDLINGDEDKFGKDGETEPEKLGLKYEEILPGDVLAKAPYIENTGVHPMYVRATVTVTNAKELVAAIEAAEGEDAWKNPGTLLKGTNDGNVIRWEWDNNDTTYDEQTETLVYTFYYNKALAAGTFTYPVFTGVEIPKELTVAQAAELVNFDVTVLAEVIQSENLEGVSNAQEAFEKYWE